MEIKGFVKHVIKGTLCSVIISLILVLITAILMINIEFSKSVLYLSSVIVSCLALVIGAVIAAKAHGSKGWLVGFAVGFIYYIALYIISIIFGGGLTFSVYEFYKLLMSIAVGTLAGMIGINI